MEFLTKRRKRMAGCSTAQRKKAQCLLLEKLSEILLNHIQNLEFFPVSFRRFRIRENLRRLILILEFKLLLRTLLANAIPRPIRRIMPAWNPTSLSCPFFIPIWTHIPMFFQCLLYDWDSYLLNHIKEATFFLADRQSKRVPCTEPFYLSSNQTSDNGMGRRLSYLRHKESL
ncbi:hypothetical protein VNO78_35178 [Psophocarpus tetragonolobus]|uniref:Uncharacterized protein n=1 Tax=Psophocarpus tetragonolobus TaxID=3891 RepID=A0AAN9NNV2_PSOTE